MSYTFFVKSPAAPDFSVLIPALNIPDLKCYEGEIPEKGRWPEVVLHFYRDKVSARPAEIEYEDGIFNVRALALSSPEDYELAFAFVEKFAEHAKSNVESEEGERFPVAELRRKFGANWVAKQNAFAAKSFAFSASEGETVEIEGPVRNYYFGPRTLKELAAAGPDVQFAARLLEAIRAIQYIDPEKYFPAEAMEAESEDSEQSLTCAVWGPNVAYLFPPVEFLVLVVNELQDDTLMIPRSALPEIAAGLFKPLDEEQVLVEAIASENWPAFIEKARKFEVKPAKGS